MILSGLESVIKNEYCEIFWDFPRNTGKKIQHHRSDVMVIYKKNGNVLSLTLCFHEPKKWKYDRIRQTEEKKCIKVWSIISRNFGM